MNILRAKKAENNEFVTHLVVLYICKNVHVQHSHNEHVLWPLWRARDITEHKNISKVPNIFIL